MQGKPIFIGCNEHGYYTATGNISCVLLSTLNLLKDSYAVDHGSLGRIIRKWGQLLAQDEDATFLAPANIPLTIEHITDGAFFGRVIAPNVSQSLKRMGISDRYALDSEYIDGSMLPLIYVSEENDTICHAVAALRFNPRQGFHVIDDGKPVDMATLPAPGLAYRIERNR
jgi:hypothetical protein